MTIQSFQCPACGAPLLPRGSAPVVSCPHCLTSAIVPEALRLDDAEQWETIVFDPFTSNDNNWTVGSQTSEYFMPMQQTIQEGRYRWEAVTGRDSSISTAWLKGPRLSDFHLAVTAKHITGTKPESSWGIVFRVKGNRHYYFFHITDSQLFAISMVADDQWHQLVDWDRSRAIKPMGANRLEVIAQDSHFIFLINGELAGELDDDHYAEGWVGLGVESYRKGEKLVFDFLDFTLRGPRD